MTMEYEMNRIGWLFAGVVAGRLVFGRSGERLAFKSWDGVRAFLDGQNV